MNTLYHSQAGDLHTPAMGIHLGTPLSLSLSENAMRAEPSMDMQGFHPHMFQANPFQQNPFCQQQSYAPSSFVHQDSGYGIGDSPENEIQVESEMSREMIAASLTNQDMTGSMAAPPLPAADKYASNTTTNALTKSTSNLPDRFRFHVTLNAPTAMIRHSDEIPVSYLNKGQAYTISIMDSTPLPPALGPVKYRTFIRISFEEEQQRQKPSACWQLWKEGRGLAEAHQRGGKLQAVEYVDPNQQGGEDDTRRPHLELDTASFDSFSVIWTPVQGMGTADCSVAVRFNFLSTDFSHSKGVKGIPVRLCAKTQMISFGTPDSPPVSDPEVCFCKVKLFRDHGAERKLSNDVAHVKKTIEKLKQQISELESGVRESGKRKRTGSTAGKCGNERPGKVQKHKRTWSISSHNSSGRPAMEEDLHMKLATVQDMFTSTRPVSVLYLKGIEQDDPALYPVTLPGQPQDLTKIEPPSRRTSWDQRPSEETTPANSCIVSMSPSSHSIPSQTRPKEKAVLKRSSTLVLSRQASSDWPASADFSHVPKPKTFESPKLETTSIKKSTVDDTLPSWIEVVDIDPSYHPPPERQVKPIACFYILIKVCGEKPDDCYYRAVYLMRRTFEDLVHSIAAKCDVGASRVQRALRINPKGIQILLDDEVVRELPEGQDMLVEFNEIKLDSSIKQESLLGEIDLDRPAPASALEMKLIF